MHSSNWKQLLGQSCSITSNGIESVWCVVCADILEKQRGIFPLFREWMRREMNSSEAFQFVTGEQSESRSGARNKMRFFPLPSALCSSVFSLLLLANKFGSKSQNWRRLVCFKELLLLFGIQKASFERCIVFLLIARDCLEKRRSLGKWNEKLLSWVLVLSHTEVLWQLVHLAVNKISPHYAWVGCSAGEKFHRSGFSNPSWLAHLKMETLLPSGLLFSVEILGSAPNCAEN